jgi:high-affinity iron transporter
MVNVFNVSAFFIVLREVLEACLVVGIVIAYLQKTGATHLQPTVWISAGLGVALSAVIGIAFTVVYYTKSKAIFSGKGEQMFECVTFLLAAALLTWMIVWMLRVGKDLRGKIEQDVNQRIEGESGRAKWAIFFLIFVQVFREGIETFIFLFGARSESSSVVDKSAWKGIILPGIIGLMVAIAIAYFVFRGLLTFDIQSVFLVSSIILMSFAAGLTSRAFHELQETGYIGDFEVDNIEKDWWNAAMWTTSGCCNHEENQFFATLNVLFGYVDSPSFVQFIGYFGYWFIVLPILVALNWSVIRSYPNKIAKYARVMSGTSLLCLLIGFIYAVSNATWTGIVVTTLGLALSVLACLGTFDILANTFRALKNMRRSLLLGAAVGLGAYTLFTAILHIVQMACIGRSCHLPNFYYWGLILDQDWLDEPRTEALDAYNALAVLSVSLTVTVFFFSTMAILLYLFVVHLGSDGGYVYDNTSLVYDKEQVSSDSAGQADETGHIQQP